MPNPSSPFGPFSPLQSFFAPWLSAAQLKPGEGKGKGIEALPGWGPALESQARLWSEFIEMQRKLWSFYNPLLQAAPVFLNGQTKTVAEDETGLEPAETVDGIPDAFELQARTWNHFLDANRSFWSTMSWPASAAALQDASTVAAEETDDSGEEEAPAPAKAVRRGPAVRKQARSKR